MIYFYRYGRADSTAIARLAAIGFDYPVLFRYLWARDCPAGGQVSESEHQTMSRKTIREQVKETIKGRGIDAALRLGRTGLTAKQKRFAEGIVLEGLTGADAYRQAYSAKGSPKSVGTNASKLKAQARIQLELQALEQAKQVAALHTAEALRSLVISSLTSALIDPETKPATRIQAAKVLGQVTEVAAFTERKEITHIQDSGAIRSQILDQLKGLMLGTADAQDVDANSLLVELAGDEPHPGGTPPNVERDSGAHMHSNEHEQFPAESEHPPSSLEAQTPGGDISEDMAFLMLNTETPPLGSEVDNIGGDISGKKRANDNVIINDED